MKRIGSTALAIILTTPLAFAAVVKTTFMTPDGALRVTASSKTTGKDITFTVCEYFDAQTGAVVDELQFPGIGFDSEQDLMQFCLANAPGQ